MAKKFKFNLLRKEVDSFLSQIIYFFTNYARYIIILVQIFVLLVFFIKIALDQSIIDLKEGIDQKNQIILSSEPMINTNNALYEKIKYVGQIFKELDKQYESSNVLLKNIPASVVLDKMSLNEKQVFISGQTTQPLDIKRLENRLNQKLNNRTTVNNISKDGYFYQFVLTIKL